MNDQTIDETQPVPLKAEGEHLSSDATIPVPIRPSAQEASFSDETASPAGSASEDVDTAPTLPVEINSRSVPTEPAAAADLEVTRAVPVEPVQPAPLAPDLSGYADTVGLPVEVLQPEPSARIKKRSRLLIPALGLLAVLLVAALSALGGYNSGIGMRKAAEATLRSSRASEQFELAQQDLENRQYDRARQRLEYIAQIEPGHPGVTDLLAEVLAQVNATATPTAAPTLAVVPTADTRGIEQLFEQTRQLLANSEWTNAIDSALRVRKEDANFKPVEIDGILYVALRNRGKDKIRKQSDLEGGIYDLTQASRFGPLDAEAQGDLTWASVYITGASFWDLDWEKVLYYFSQVAPALPNLSDGNMTAAERYRRALIGYGDALSKQGLPCDAIVQYEEALKIGPDDQAQQGLDQASAACSGGGNGTTEGGGEPQPTQPGKKKLPKP